MNQCDFCLKDCQILSSFSLLKITYYGKHISGSQAIKIFGNDFMQSISSRVLDKICSFCINLLVKSYSFVQQVIEAGQTSKPCSDKEKLRYLLAKSENDEIVPAQVQAPKYFEKSKRLYKCFECPETFISFQQRKSHQEAQHTSEDIGTEALCPYCFSLHYNNECLEDHLKEHIDGKFQCLQCQKKLQTKGHLLHHVNTKHGFNTLPYFCSICPADLSSPKPYASKDFLKEHYQNNHVDSFLNQEDPQDNIDFEVTEEFLDDTFNALDFEDLDLNLLEILHFQSMDSKRELAYPCPKCHESYNVIKDLFLHLAKVHEMEVLTCNQCEKSFKTLDSLMTHKKFHCHIHLEKDFECSLCQKKFKSQAALLYHKKTHTNIPRHECPFCSKWFSLDFNLKKHIRSIHSSVKDHICALCDKQFSTLDHLKKHVLSLHQHDRKFICHFCAKAFTQSGHLKQHLAIHTTGKSYQCSLCDKKFWKKIDLKKHLAKNHQIEEEQSEKDHQLSSEDQ